MTIHAHVSTSVFASLLHYSPPGTALLELVLFVVLLRVTATETSSRSITPDAIWTLCLAGVLRVPPWPAVVAAAVAGSVVPLAARGATRGGLGWGDLKLCFALHLCAGPVAGLAGVLTAALVALSVAGLRCVRRGASSCEAGIAFGPYLVAGVTGAVLVEAACVA